MGEHQHCSSSAGTEVTAPSPFHQDFSDHPEQSPVLQNLGAPSSKWPEQWLFHHVVSKAENEFAL